MKCKKLLTVSGPEDLIINRFFSDISVKRRETILTISYSIETDTPVQTEIVRVNSLGTTVITEITRFKNRSLGYVYLKPIQNLHSCFL